LHALPKRHISHASRAKKQKKDARKLKIPLKNGQKFDETPCQIPGRCTMGNIFWWACNRGDFKKDSNSRIKSNFKISEKKNKRQKAKIAKLDKSHVSCHDLLT
jgi:hypothetical protein